MSIWPGYRSFFIAGGLMLAALSALQAAPAIDVPAFGLYPAEHFVVTNGRCGDCAGLPQALNFFRDETIAVPEAGRKQAGFDRKLPVSKDLAAWVAATPVGSEFAYPPLVWLGAPQSVEATLAADGATLSIGGQETPLKLTPRLPLNGAYFNEKSVAFFHGQPLKIRGNSQADGFLARTFWPQTFRLPTQPQQASLATTPQALRDWLRRQPNGGAQSPFAVESVWRRGDSSGPQAGQAVIGLMLNGAQGDDDEAHGGHFALMSGRIGAQGAMDDWLVYNFYTLDSVSEKGIIAAPVPLDNYLGDLNSGQAWYRPSYLLVATLKAGRTAVHLQSAFGRVFNQFYRHQFVYQHARANCAGTSVTTARTLGWQVPARGAESWPKAIFGLPLVAIKEGSLSKGKGAFDYLTEDQTRLYPAAAFEEMGADLLRLARGETGRNLTEFERLLAEDIEEILLVRVPQFPSSRAWGDFPVENSVEYTARVPTDPALQKIIPVPARPFPPELRDPLTPAEPPLRSDYALVAWAAAILITILLILRRLLA